MNMLIAAADAARFYAALEAAMALAALGHGVRIFVQAEAVAMLRPPVGYDGDAARRAAGQPGLAAMLDEALASDISLSLCQTGLEMARMTAADIDPRIAATGLVAWLAECGAKDRLLVF